MSVIIKGMEMPKNCEDCPMLEGDRMDGLCHAASKWLDDDEYWTWYVYPEGDMDDSKPCNCPLVPAADVREIKRGRWSFDTIIFTDADGVSRSGMRGYKCSECDGFCIGESNFCPNCGAKMEEGEER